MSVQVREQLAPSLDKVNNPEVRVFGEHEHKRVPVFNLIMMPQVRANLNPELPAIKESIRSGGLLNRPDIAVMSRQTFSEYVAFVNDIWSSDVRVEDYDDMAIDGLYHLVAAGHTRTEGIRQIAEEDGVIHEVICKVHDADDPMRIVAIQLDENLHSKPPQERTALVIVEAYLLGVRNKSWSNEAEFVAAVGAKFSEQQVKDAVGFARLPDEVRSAVFSRKLPYNAALTLGRGTDTIRDYTMAQLGYVMLADEKQEEIYKTTFDATITLLVAEVFNRELNSTAARKYIQAKIDKFARATQKLYGVADINEPRIAMATARDQDEVYARQVQREFERKMEEVAARSVASTEDALRLYSRMSGLDTTEAQKRMARGRERLVRSMGDVGLFDVSISDKQLEAEFSSPLF